MSWQTIDTAPPGGRGPFGPWLILAHKDHRWRRIGHYYAACNRWYYSGGGHGDIPTHWMLLPELIDLP